MSIKDWWNSRSYWLKGGIIGIILEVIFIILAGLSIRIPFLLLSPPITSFLIRLTAISSSKLIILTLLLSILPILEILIYSFLIGAIIGFILEKINNRKIIQTILIIAILLFMGLFIIGLFSQPKIINRPATLDEIRNDLNNNSIIMNGGACLLYNQELLRMECIFTAEESCKALGDKTFYQGLLCTAEQLSTICAPTNKTEIIEGKEYFIDSCGNQANPYNSSKINDKEYWEKVTI